MFLLFAIVLIYGNLTYAISYNRSEEFSPVKLTYDDLRIFLQRIHATLPSSETQSDNQDIINKLTISDGKIQIDIDIANNWDINDIGRFPKVAFDLRYEWYNPKSKIKNIQIRFSDFSRTILVQGTDSYQVDSAYDSLAGIVNEHTSWIGGFFFRIVGVSCLWGISMILCVPSLFSVDLPLSPNRKLILSCLGLMIVLTTITLPYDKWFPGFAIYAGPLSFAERYAPQITLIGLPLAIISIILTSIPIFRSHRPTSRKR
jgi:hypothetical protein